MGHHECIHRFSRRRSSHPCNGCTGIAEALIATAIGLFAAIPAVLAFNHYTGKGETVYSDRALFAEEMVALLQRQSLGETKEHD